jgi:hypothetical protein
VSLSDKRVRRILNEKFVCAWLNIKDEASAGSSFAHKPSDPAPGLLRGNGEHNNQILLLTPDGRILGALAGYIGPDDLLEELKFGLTTLASLPKAPEEKRKEVLAKAHRKFAKQLEARKPTGQLAEVEERMQKQIAKLQQAMPQVSGMNIGLTIGSKRGVEDHRFVMEHPLLPVDSFQTEMLVGNARTFFGSSVNGTAGERIGGDRPPGSRKP